MSIPIEKIDLLASSAINGTEKQKRRLCQGVAKYLILRTMFECKIINEGFMNLFYDYYGLKRRESYLNRKEIFNLLRNGKSNVSLHEVISRIANNTNEFSYATKVLHTLDDHLPIYDSYVERFTGIRNRDMAAYNALCQFYKQQPGLDKLVDAYKTIVCTKDCQDIISYGNDDFTPDQALTITKVKKIDFMIWGFGKK